MVQAEDAFFGEGPAQGLGMAPGGGEMPDVGMVDPFFGLAEGAGLGFSLPEKAPLLGKAGQIPLDEVGVNDREAQALAQVHREPGVTAAEALGIPQVIPAFGVGDAFLEK